MYKLFLDTCYKNLNIIILKDDNVLDYYSEECNKKQSEYLFTKLDELFKKNNVVKKDLGEVYITIGPGSYTGVRIALTLAKVLCSIKNIPLYTISSLKFYAGGNPNTLVIMDARAERAYVGIYDNNKEILKDQIKYLKDIDTKDYNIVLDGELVGKKHKDIDIVKAFNNTKSEFKKVDNIDTLVPVYLKESDEYYR